MRTIIYLTILILTIVPATALIAGGTSPIINFSECDYLGVEVEAERRIDAGEYWFENCTQVEAGIDGNPDRWLCECHDDYTLYLGTDIRAVNTYHITAEYYTEEDKEGRGTRTIYISRTCPECEQINETEEPEECGDATHCINNPELKGCEYDGCNWCCDNICTSMFCYDEEMVFPEPKLNETPDINQTNKTVPPVSDKETTANWLLWLLYMMGALFIVCFLVVLVEKLLDKIESEEDEEPEEGKNKPRIR